MNLALVHDPVAAEPLAGVCPLVLAGHRHKREVSRIDQPDGEIPPEGRTLLMVAGLDRRRGAARPRGRGADAAGAVGALLRRRAQELQAYDDITVGGTGQSEVTLQRNIVRPDDEAPVVPSPSPSTSSRRPVVRRPVVGSRHGRHLLTRARVRRSEGRRGDPNQDVLGAGRGGQPQGAVGRGRRRA